MTEGRSTGVPTIQAKLLANGSPRASFETTDERLTFLVYIPTHGIKDVVENVVENVVESNVTLANYFGVNTRTIQRDLNVLQTEGFLRHVGPDKGGHWEVVDNKETK